MNVTIEGSKIPTKFYVRSFSLSVVINETAHRAHDCVLHFFANRSNLKTIS